MIIKGHVKISVNDSFIPFHLSLFIGAIVALSNTTYTVTEGVDSSVLVCAQITSPPTDEVCPVTFSFEVIVRVEGSELERTWYILALNVCIA